MKKIALLIGILMIGSIFAFTFANAMTAVDTRIGVTGKAVTLFGDEETPAEVDEYVEEYSIDSVDVYEVETQLEGDSDSIPGDINQKFRKLVYVQGFTYDDSDRAALVNGLFLRTTVYVGGDAEVDSFTKGKLKIAGRTFDVERSDDFNELSGFYELRGPQGETGILEIELKDSYNEGLIKHWTGSLRIEGNSVDYSGRIDLYTEDKLLRPEPQRPTTEPVVTETKTSYQGTVDFEGRGFKIESVGNSGPRELNFYMYGDDESEGKLSLRLNEDRGDRRVYEGRTFIQENDGKSTEGTVYMVLEKVDSNLWEGKIEITGTTADYVMTGSVSLEVFEEKVQRNVDIDEPGRIGDLQESSNTKVENRGFFARIKGIFGLD